LQLFIVLNMRCFLILGIGLKGILRRLKIAIGILP
jgi:hypothetical protein